MEYQTLKERALSAIREGQTISFPIPVINNRGVLVDVFFVYTVDRKTRIPNKPIYCIEFDRDADEFTKVISPSYFTDIEHNPTPFRMPNNYRQNAEAVWNMYEDVRTEISAGFVGALVSQYTKLISQTSQECLMPYYKAVAPRIFK